MATSNGSHLKIQTQSIFNDHHTDEQFKQFYGSAANHFLMGVEKWRYKVVSVHMACDVQGWVPTLDMLSDFVTASNKRDINLGVETIDTHGVVHGKQFETVTLGNVRFSEFTIYDKLLKADKVGARTYWETIYRNNCPDYDNQQQVRRVEVRFSHNVILQISDFLVKQFFDTLPADFSPSEAFVMQANDETGLRSYFQLWTILLNEVDWGGDRYVDLKRLYKKLISERDPEQTEKTNVKMALANIVSVAARHFLDILQDPYNLIDNTDLGLTAFVEDFIDSLQHIARGGFMIAVEKVFSYGFRGYNYWRDRLIDYLQEAFRRRLLCRGSA
jgi:hypothetical protein